MRMLFLFFVSGLLVLSEPVGGQGVAGEWDATMNTPGGARTFKVVFKVDGEKLTGTVKREAGNVPLQGTVKGNTLKFSYEVTYNGGALILTVSANLDGDVITGTVDFGGAARDNFSAKRVAASTSSRPVDTFQSDLGESALRLPQQAWRPAESNP